jgi:hypothetical protein
MSLTNDRTKQLIAEANERLNGVYPSADAYYADKDLVRTLTAQLASKNQTETDPMGFWFGRQSN